MEIPNKNQQDTLPYEKLALLGIDREKADMLPQDVKQKLMQGEVTPLLQVSIDTGNGMVISLPLKLQLAADKDGNPTLIAYPVQRELSVDRNNELRLSQQELDALRRGDVLQKAIDIRHRPQGTSGLQDRKRRPQGVGASAEIPL